MAQKGITDTDMGLADIFKEMEKLKSMCVKVGVTEDVGSQTVDGGLTLAEIAARNELGVLGPPFSQYGGGKWFIPPRPFVRGWADGKREQIVKTQENLGKLVTSGKLDADTAIRRLGEFGQNGVKSYINRGSFTPNSHITIHGSKPNKKGKKFIKGKGSSRPLIDTKNLVNNGIRFQVIEKPVDMVSEK
jgi:hypothetical protein